MVAEDGIIPTGADGIAVEFDVILDNVLVILHFQVINPAFSISSRIDRTKLNSESADKCGPTVHPIRKFVGIKDGRLEIFECGSAKIRQGKSDFCGVVLIGRVVAEIQITEQDEVIEFPGV